MRSLLHKISISSVNQASKPLRIKFFEGVRNKFLATCWDIVLAPLSRRLPFM